MLFYCVKSDYYICFYIFVSECCVFDRYNMYMFCEHFLIGLAQILQKVFVFKCLSKIIYLLQRNKSCIFIV